MAFLSSLLGGVWGYVGSAAIGAGIAASAMHAIDNGTIQANKATYEANQKAESDLAARVATDNLTKLQSQLQQTAADKASVDKELADAKLNTDALVSSLQLGTTSLYVRAQCPAGSGGVPQAAAAGPAVHGSATVKLDGDTAKRLVALTAEADKTAILLQQCQAYVRAVTK